MFWYETTKCEDYYTRNQLIYVMFLDLIQRLSQFVALVFLRTTIFHRTPNTMAMVKHVWWIPVSFRFHQHIVIVFAPVPTNVKRISQLKNITQYESILYWVHVVVFIYSNYTCYKICLSCHMMVYCSIECNAPHYVELHFEIEILPDEPLLGKKRFVDYHTGKTFQSEKNKKLIWLLWLLDLYM